jgi:head-tail adaptor
MESSEQASSESKKKKTIIEIHYRTQEQAQRKKKKKKRKCDIKSDAYTRYDKKHIDGDTYTIQKIQEE